MWFKKKKKQFVAKGGTEVKVGGTKKEEAFQCVQKETEAAFQFGVTCFEVCILTLLTSSHYAK